MSEIATNRLLKNQEKLSGNLLVFADHEVVDGLTKMNRLMQLVQALDLPVQKLST